MFQGGVLVAQMRGANAPQLLRMITEQLAYEHKVLEGNAERKEVIYLFTAYTCSKDNHCIKGVSLF